MKTFGLAFFFAALSDSDIEDVHICFAQEAQGDAAGDAFIIRMRRKEESFGSIGSERRFWRWSETAQGVGLTFPDEADVFRNKMVVRVHEDKYPDLIGESEFDAVRR